MNRVGVRIPPMAGRAVIVTGGNSGIGLWTARALAARGARVVLGCRDVGRGGRAAQWITRREPGSEVSVAALQLASIDAVREFAGGWSGPLDLLVNNAGVMAPPELTRTRDGFELQFGTNHLGHFVLTGLLLPRLLEAEHGRVVTVASIAHHGGTPAVLEGNVGIGYDPGKAYANSKLANLLFALELHRRLAQRGLSVVSTAAHPGVSATGLATDPEGMGARRLVRALAPVVLRIATQSPRAGARATLYAATEAAPGSYTGPQWIGETRGRLGPARLSEPARDEALASRLWDVSEQLSGLRYPWPASP